MIGSDDYWPFGWNVAQAFYLWTKASHEERRQESAQGSIGQVVEHATNLVAIARYDTI